MKNQYWKNLQNTKLKNRLMMNQVYESYIPLLNIFDVLRDLVPFVQFKKCEKHL